MLATEKPSPISNPLTPPMLMIAAASLASSFSKTGEPKPGGTPMDLTSIAPPIESPSLLTLSISASISANLDLSAIRRGFFSI